NAPRGVLHGHDGANGGFIHWTGTAIAATAVTIVLGDSQGVFARAAIMAVISDSTGVSTHIYNVVAVGGTLDPTVSAGNVNRFDVSSNALRVYRQSGTATFTVSAWVVWL